MVNDDDWMFCGSTAICNGDTVLTTYCGRAYEFYDFTADSKRKGILKDRKLIKDYEFSDMLNVVFDYWDGRMFVE